MSCIWIVDGWVNEVDLGENKKHMCGVVYPLMTDICYCANVNLNFVELDRSKSQPRT